MNSNSLISVVLPARNAGRTVAAAIQSILDQSYSNFELLIADDGSTDSTRQIAESFDDHRIKVLSDGQRQGISKRLNQLIASSRGDFIARMDADDIALPHRLARQLEYLATHPTVDLVGSSILVFRDDGSQLGILPIKTAHHEICARPYSGFYLPHPTWMGRREWFLRNQYDACADGVEDQQLLFRTHGTSHFACLPEALLGYREDRRTLKKLWKRRWIFFNVFLRAMLKAREYRSALLLVMFQCAKALADIGNLIFHIKTLRSPLRSAEANVAQEWKEVWNAAHRRVHVL